MLDKEKVSMCEWDNAMTMLSSNFKKDDDQEKKELIVVGNEQSWETNKREEEQPCYDLFPLIVFIPLCAVAEIIAALLYFYVNEEFGIAFSSVAIPWFICTIYLIFNPPDRDKQKKGKKQKKANLIKEGGLFRSIKEIEGLLEERDDKKLAKQLKQIRKKAVALEDVIPTQSQYELFIQTRLEMYIMPYLEYIAKYDGKLNKADQQRFEETFGKLEAVLDSKKKSEVDAWSDSKKVEMEVTEKELDNVLSEYKQRQEWR